MSRRSDSPRTSTAQRRVLLPQRINASSDARTYRESALHGRDSLPGHQIVLFASVACFWGFVWLILHLHLASPLGPPATKVGGISRKRRVTARRFASSSSYPNRLWLESSAHPLAVPTFETFPVD